jgi:DNA-binding NarL/FixJ family response regulator
MRCGAGVATLISVPIRCLIVDDNASFLVAARVLLERQGLVVAGVASTGAEALRQADALRPDVVLVDISLGEESGLDLARRLVEHDLGRDAAVVLISTRAEDDVAELVAASPAAGFVPKSALSASAIRRIVDGRPR